MTESKRRNLQQIKRSLNLLAAMRGLVLWYAIEKLFELDIGILPQQIVLIGLIAQGSRMIFEIPSSVIADRWSRRDVLIWSNLVMIACTFVLGISNGFVLYTVGSVLWGISIALSSGTYEAYAYDLLATKRMGERFRSIYGRMFSIEVFLIGFAGIIAGIISSYFGFRLSYYLSIIPGLISIGMLLRMVEPKIARTIDSGVGSFRHVISSISLLNNKKLRWTAWLYILIIGFQTIWYEYYQLIGLDIKIPVPIFGVLIAVLTLGLTLGGELSHRAAATKQLISLLWLVLLITQLVGLQFASVPFALINIFLTFIAVAALRIYLELHIQNNIEASRRATILSLVTGLGYVAFIISGFALAFLLPKFGIRPTIMLVSFPLVAMIIIDLLRRVPWATGEIKDA